MLFVGGVGVGVGLGLGLAVFVLDGLEPFVVVTGVELVPPVVLTEPA